MHLHHIENGLILFNFPEVEGFDYGFNLYGLRNEDDILLIDAAFRSQARRVLRELRKGLSLTHLVATHFHNDHIAGLMALPEGITLLGSPKYRRTLSKHIPQKVTPVQFEEAFSFGRFSLRFIPAPGHSQCSILIDINGEYLHAGDNLMARYDGRRILPWVQRGHIEEHIQSLNLIRAMKTDGVLLSHGPMIEGKKNIAREIDLRIMYLEKMLDPSPGITLEEVLADSPENWVGHDHFREILKGHQQGSQPV